MDGPCAMAGSGQGGCRRCVILAKPHCASSISPLPLSHGLGIATTAAPVSARRTRMNSASCSAVQPTLCVRSRTSGVELPDAYSQESSECHPEEVGQQEQGGDAVDTDEHRHVERDEGQQQQDVHDCETDALHAEER